MYYISWGHFVSLRKVIAPERVKKYFSYGQLNQTFQCKIVIIFFSSVESCVLGANKNRLIETVRMSTYNICFG